MATRRKKPSKKPKAAPAAPRKPGRPTADVDAETVEKLAAIQCTMTEIAAVAGCSVATLERRFAEIIKRGQDNGRASLRRAQWKLAQAGNPTMLIWLGKQILGQSDDADDPSDHRPVPKGLLVKSPVPDTRKKSTAAAGKELAN